MQDLSKFQRMMVTLDLTEMDVYLIKYASMIAKAFEIDAVYFLHVTTSLELPEEIQEKYGNMMAPVDETLEREMQVVIDEYFEKPENCDMQIKVQAGAVTDEILKFAKVKVVDLILLGRKEELSGSGLHSKKIAKGSASSVIFVPEEEKYELKKILVSIDYSEHSKMAFEIAIDIQKKTGAKLLSNNVYRVPVGFAKSGKSYEEFAEIMLENTKEQCDKFFSQMNLEGVDYDHTYALDDDPHPADKIYRTGAELDVDMIILGSKGRSSAAAFLIGSVAEKLLMEDNDIPMFLVKKGNENMSFLEALFRL
ncbi:universal stress protein [Roseivirga sp.]|uniref:universal stress protein n=1 Tax=Roseivirga sp. TaxID=1964215 RepID=UPI003B8C85F6